MYPLPQLGSIKRATEISKMSRSWVQLRHIKYLRGKLQPSNLVLRSKGDAVRNDGSYLGKHDGSQNSFVGKCKKKAKTLRAYVSSTFGEGKMSVEETKLPPAQTNAFSNKFQGIVSWFRGKPVNTDGEQILANPQKVPTKEKVKTRFKKVAQDLGDKQDELRLLYNDYYQRFRSRFSLWSLLPSLKRFRNLSFGLAFTIAFGFGLGKALPQAAAEVVLGIERMKREEELHSKELESIRDHASGY